MVEFGVEWLNRPIPGLHPAGGGKRLTEDPEERRMFDQQAKLCGGPLQAIAVALTIWSHAAPPRGSYGKVLAIYANECMKAAARSHSGASE